MVILSELCNIQNRKKTTLRVVVGLRLECTSSLHSVWFVSHGLGKTKLVVRPPALENVFFLKICKSLSSTTLISNAL